MRDCWRFRLPFVKLRGGALSLSATASTRTHAIMAASAAIYTAACSTNLDYLDNGAGAKADSSITDATAGSDADGASSDDAASVDDAEEAAVIDVADAADVADVANLTEAGPAPALLPDAATITCPTTIDDSLTSSGGTQTGRVSRIPPTSACAMTKTFPMTGADPMNPHLYNAYRFANATAASSCYTFLLTSGWTPSVGDASTPGDAGRDGSTQNDASADASAQNDASTDASAQMDGSAGPPLYMMAYSTFYPKNLALGYLGDVGAQLTSPYTMSITVPAGGTVDVVVSAIEIAPAGVGPYTLTCSKQ
jgi:hypothetical protein